MRFTPHYREPDEREYTPERDIDGGHKMTVIQLPPGYPWDRTHQPVAQAAAPKMNAAPKKTRKRKHENEPLSGSVASAHSNPGNLNPIGQPVTVGIACPKCNKVFETIWDHRPTVDEMKAERERVMQLHHCEEPFCKRGGRL